MDDREELIALRRLAELEAKAGNSPEQQIAWSDVPVSAAKNLPSSAINFAKNIYQAVTSPIQTAKAVGSTAAGGLENLAQYLTQQNANRGGQISPREQEVLGANTENMQNASALASALKNRYGGEEQIKTTLATDPVGVLSDVSTLGVNAVNPISLAGKLGSKVSGAVGTGAKELLGMTTGVGGENIKQAFQSGKEGNTTFMRNMSGESSLLDVLSQAKDALQNMRMDRTQEYRKNIATTSANTARLNFQPIQDALDSVVDSMKSGTHWKIGDSEVNKIKELQQVVAEWKADPQMHTAMGLDALKQRLDALYPDSPMQQQAQRAITGVRNKVKDTIVNQSPEYATTMGAYEEAIKLENEIKRALSLGDNASADTALRKLQSLSRNNVQTNYGYRQQLADALKEKGGEDLMPAIAGQSMNSWLSRGLAGKMQNMATLGGATMNPLALALLPLQSPKVVGSAAYSAGRLAAAKNKIGSASPVTAEEAKYIANILAQANKTNSD